MASSASSSNLSPASSFHSWNHDVFLSFRGEDTRKTFVDHLYTSLIQQGIHTYKDDEALPRGESIGPALLKAVLESRIVITIFSENYANSSWCLDELAYIMKCMDEKGQIVIPIFYHVDPSEVRKQKGKYGEAFVKHESENSSKVESWRKALAVAGSLSGWVPEDIENGHESKFIKEIVKTTSHRLYSLISNEKDHLIGIKIRVQELKSKLEFSSGGVLMIGIWGVGGGGKTTLASSIYDDISDKFNGCCFVENVREKSSRNGIEKLQEKFLSGLLKQKVQIWRVEEGKRMIKSKLFHRKVLIVLDDVSEHKQLEALVGSHDWFGEGSRVIITTRDENLLNSFKVNVIHNISLLNDNEAFELFCKHTHRDNIRSIEDHELVLKEVVSYARGLPLALKVLGSFLCDKDKNEFKSALARLKDMSHANILETLKISYDGLQQVEKKLFLDIACFFRGAYKNNAMEIFDACDLHPVIGVKVLIQKALITISEGRFDMHDLIQEMGHYIVRGSYPNNPEKHTRVWKLEDVQIIWAMDETKELDTIEAIRVSSYMYDSLPHYNRQVVANMKKLRWIDWRVRRHANFLPINFPLGDLCCLILTGGQQRQLWKGYKYLPKLKMIKLQSFEELLKTPDFGGLPNLEKFMLNDCLSLEEIHPSIGGLERLVYLSIESCSNFKMFPPVKVTKKLETLIIANCKKLCITKKVTSFERYRTDFFVTCLPCCGNVSDDELSEPLLLPKGLNQIGSPFTSRALKKLTLRDCQLGDEDVDSSVWDLPNLQELDLSINLFSRLNFNVLKVPWLKWLDVAECKSLVELSGFPLHITSVRADWCDSLETVGDISNCKWLWNVSFFGRNSRLSPLCRTGDMLLLLDYMLQGNAIEDHYISFTHSARHHIPKRFVDKLVKGETFRLQLPDNWYNDYSGFLICNVNNYYALFFTLSIKQDLDKDSPPDQVWHEESNEVPKSYFHSTYVGYVSFSSLMRHGARLNPAYNVISFSIGAKYVSSFKGETMFAAELVPRKSKLGDTRIASKVATDSSEFYDEEREYGKTFMIQRHSESSIKILWRPCYWY